MSGPVPGSLPGRVRGGVLGTVEGRIRGLRHEMSVPLYRNAYALMLNTAANSLFGLLYWIFAAHTFDPAEVGRASALVSLMMLVSVLTQLNFGQALIRFLPRAGRGSPRLVGAAYGFSAGLAVLAATAVMAYCHWIRDPGDPLHVSLPLAGWFVLSTAAWSLFNLQDYALTGLRSSMWVALENGVYGVVKLVLLVVVAGSGASDGVFTSWTAPVIALLVPVNLLLFRRILPGHAREADEGAGLPERRTLVRYMAGDYAGQVFNQAVSSFLPVLVVFLLGPAQAAFLLPAQTVFLALTMLSTSITSSLVVEGARNEAAAHRHAVEILKRISLTVLPVATVIALVAPWLLQLYGTEYRQNATLLLQLLMLSTFPRVIVILYMTMSRLQNRTSRLAVLQGVHAAVLLAGTAAFAERLGLDAVGWSWLGVEIAMAIAVAPRVVRWLRPPGTGPHDETTVMARVDAPLAEDRTDILARVRPGCAGAGQPDRDLDLDRPDDPPTEPLQQVRS